METVQVQCPACLGTGLFHGYAQLPGVYVVCVKCLGKAYLKMIPFESLVIVESPVRTVQFPDGREITYVQFLQDNSN